MKKILNFGAAAGIIMLVLSAGRYDTCLLTGESVTFGILLPAVVGTALILLSINEKTVSKCVYRFFQRLDKRLAYNRQTPTVLRSKG